MPAREKDSYSIQSVENALDVLEALCEEGEEVRISHLSQRLGMNKTSVFRLLATFEGRGYVEKEQKSGKYRLGGSAYEIGQKLLLRMGLLRKAKPVMERLARSSNEAVYLAIQRSNDILLIDMVDTIQQVKTVPLVGRRFPLGQVSPGKVILAFGKAGSDMQDSSSIQESGYSQDSGSFGEGVSSLSVPLFNSRSEVTGALCLLGPDYRFTGDRVQDELVQKLRDAGEVISSRLGYVGHFITKDIYR